MKISGASNNLGNINSLFNTFAQGKTMMYANKLSNSKFLFPDSKEAGKAPSNAAGTEKETISSDTVSYINNIKGAAEDLSGALKALSAYSFDKTDEKADDKTDATAANAADGDKAEATGANQNKAAMSAVKDMVNSYNSLFSAAAENVNDPKAQGLASRLMNVSSVYSRSLSDIGIGIDGSGKMTIDEKKLEKAAENGSLEKFFTQDAGKNYGFTNQLEKIANNVANNTSAFVSSSSTGNSLSGNFGYSDFGNPTQMNVLRSGSVFDYSF